MEKNKSLITTTCIQMNWIEIKEIHRYQKVEQNILKIKFIDLIIINK
jgi:hypothetical protein